MSDVTGVVAMVHGSASSLDEASLADYLGRIMRGRTPTAEQVADLRRRYELIGGTSHLLERSHRQVEALAEALGSSFRVTLGAKHSPPFIADSVAELADAGVRRVIGLGLAPHESLLTTGQYDEAGAKAAATAGVEWKMVRSWHLEPELIVLWSDLLRDAVAVMADHPPRLLFSAHSLPIRPGDPYPGQVVETAAAIGYAAKLAPGDWDVVYQSVPPGVDPSTWLGPNISDSYAAPAVLVAPIGFVSDHLEVLYDLDVQAKDEAAAAGVELRRTGMPNDDPRLARAMAAAVNVVADVAV